MECIIIKWAKLLLFCLNSASLLTFSAIRSRSHLVFLLLKALLNHVPRFISAEMHSWKWCCGSNGESTWTKVTTTLNVTRERVAITWTAGDKTSEHDSSSKQEDGVKKKQKIKAHPRVDWPRLSCRSRCSIVQQSPVSWPGLTHPRLLLRRDGPARRLRGPFERKSHSQ